MGVGDTMRVSLSANPVEEIYAAKKILRAAGLRQDGLSFPLYAHGRFSFGDKRVVPYIGIEAGVDLAQKGLYSGIDFGTRLRRIGGKRGSSWWLAGSMDMLGTDLYHIAIKFGRSF